MEVGDDNSSEVEEDVVLLSSETSVEGDGEHGKHGDEGEALNGKVFDVMDRFARPGETVDGMIRRVGMMVVCREVAKAEKEGYVIRGDESMRGQQQGWRNQASSFVGQLKSSGGGARRSHGTDGGGTSRSDRLLGGDKLKFSKPLYKQRRFPRKRKRTI